MSPASPLRLTPVAVVGLSGVASIAAGDDFSVAVQSGGGAAGQVWAWGRNDAGQLGDGSSLPRNVPIAVPALTGVASVSAARTWTLALKADGTVWTWGDNSAGQLGSGLGGFSNVPRAVPPLANVRMAAAGRYHALAADADGWVWGWGKDEGQLGPPGAVGVWASGTTIPRRLQNVVTLPTVLAAGAGFTHVAKTDGSVWGMGANLDRQLGSGDSTGTQALVSTSGLSLATNTWLTADADQDGLITWREYLLGLDPLNPDTNGDGVPDAVARRSCWRRSWSDWAAARSEGRPRRRRGRPGSRCRTCAPFPTG
jgi:hypothetical protein